MTIAISKSNQKSKGKTIAAKKKSNTTSPDHDISRLRAQNKVLIDALVQIRNCASEHMDKKYDLVWFALNRTRYPNHESSKKIERSVSHREELKKLKTNDCDFHHGFNCGVLATSRLFKQISDISSVIGEEVDPTNPEKVVQMHQNKVQQMKRKFPDLSVQSFP
jgi:hypothetical protein